MATKNSSTLNVTTSSSVGVDARGKTFSRSSNTTSETISRRKMTRGETAGGLLTGIFQIQMIAITILAISLGSSLTEFTTSDLVETNPNYQLTNDFVPIDDPLNTVNYIQYGDDVFDRLHGFIVGFSDFGLLVKGYWDEVIAVFEPEAVDAAVTFLIDFNRIFKTLEDATDIYDAMSSSNKTAYGVFYPEINWLVKWMYYSPAELTA
jgi:hypothetical protein